MEPSQTMQTDNNVVCVTSNGSDLPAHKRSLIRDFARSFNTRVFKLLTEHYWSVKLKACCIHATMMVAIL